MECSPLKDLTNTSPSGKKKIFGTLHIRGRGKCFLHSLNQAWTRRVKKYLWQQETTTTKTLAGRFTSNYGVQVSVRPNRTRPDQTKVAATGVLSQNASFRCFFVSFWGTSDGPLGVFYFADSEEERHISRSPCHALIYGCVSLQSEEFNIK